MARYRRAAGGGVHGGARLLRPAGRAVGGGAPARRHPARRAALADPVLLRAPGRVPAHLDRAGRVARRAGGPARTLVPRRPRGPPRGAHRRGPRGGTGRHRAAVGQRGLRRRGHAADAGSRSRSGTVHRGRRPVAGARHLASRPARSHLPPPYLLPVLPARRWRHVRRLPAAGRDGCGMTAGLVLVSTADTDLLAARASGVGWRVANPSRLDAAAVPALLDGAALVLVRLLGGRRTWPEGLAAVLAAGTPVVAVGGEATPDAELTALSTVPAGVAHDAQRYLVEGGPDNLRELHRFLSDTVLLTGVGFAAPQPTPAFGVHGVHAADPGRPTVGVLFYRAHALSGNTGFVDVLCEAIEAAGANARAVYVPSLRAVPEELSEMLRGCDALVVTVLAAGGTVAAQAGAGGDDDAWSVAALAELDFPVVQALCLTSSRQAWQDSTAALSPMDAAMQVAIPEFDGRLISVPFSFKEAGTDGIPGYVAYPERAARVAGIAVGYARLGHLRPARRRVA